MKCEHCPRPGRSMNLDDSDDPWPLCNEHALAAMAEVEHDDLNFYARVCDLLERL